MKKFTFLVFAVLAFFTVNAQIVNVCGTEPITLQVENYQNGTIEWQESIDMITWVLMPEATGTSYQFTPTQEKYYRAVVKTSTCEPLYSEISFVQLPPVANAGSDRVVGDTEVILLGNTLNNASGEWTVVSGNGVLSDPALPGAHLTGNYGETTELKWTVTNACGVSSDNVVITFQEMQARNNFIVVDNTDMLLSDSTEIANGTVRVKFSDPTIAPYDSVMLIGVRDNMSFLQKVHAFSIQDSVYTFTTVQGTFEDLISSGTLNMGDAVNQSITQGDTKSPIPTRETLKNYSGNKGITLLYSETTYSDAYAAENSAKSGDGLQINLPNLTIFESEGNELNVSIIDSYVRLAPNFVFDLDYSLPAKLENIKFGVDNAEFEYNYKFVTQVTAPINFIDEDKTLVKVTKNIIFMAGPIPVWVTANFEIIASFELGVNGGFKLEETKNYKKTFTALVMGENVQNLNLVTSSSETSTKSYNFMMQAQAIAEMKLGPKVSFKAYNIAGPFLELPLTANAELCVNNDLNWDAEASLGIEGNIGAEAKVLGHTLFDFKYNLFENALTAKLEMPYKLELLSGNFQNGAAGATLPNPIKVKVISNAGFAVPFVPVRFQLDAGNGSVTETVVYTNILGEASAVWTIGANPQSVLRISVLDCDNANVANSPLLVYANTTAAPYDCADSNLRINLATSGGFTSPSVYGGTAPYTYSTNGTSYTGTVPQFDESVSGNYTVYVKDSNGCVVPRSFSISPIMPCAGSNLAVQTYVQANTLQLSGKNGTSPYQFSVDNATAFSVQSLYINLAAGWHKAYVKDANGCTASADVRILENTSPALTAVSPANGANFIPTANVTFQWIAGNFGANTKYDIALKKDGQSYTTIALNLTGTSYTYTTALDYSSGYTWKLTAKDGAGTALDFKEFTFTTASQTPVTPVIPFLSAPADNATEVSLPVTLVWTNWQNMNEHYKYDLYLDETGATSLYALNIDAYQYTTNTLSSNKTYFWKVVLKSLETGERKESPVWSFTTTNAAGAVSVTSPTSGSAIGIGNSHTITWTGNLAGNVKIELYKGAILKAVIASSAPNSGSYVWAIPADLPAGADYRIKIRSVNYNNIFAMSGYFQLTETTSDIDGNVYPIVTIDTQTWMAADLRVTRYPNGDAIPHVTDTTEWGNLADDNNSDAYIFYNNDNGTDYGALYTYAAAIGDNWGRDNKPGQGVCPDGWHLPTDVEWTTLTDYMGGESVAGGKLKETGIMHWYSPNTGATNESGFTALPGGFLSTNGGSFGSNGYYGYWWSATEDSATSAWYRRLNYGYSYVNRNAVGKGNGLSVRCVKD